MKSIKLKNLLESVNEAHEQGEWWIDNAGELQKHGEEGKSDDDLMQQDNWKKMKASKEKIEVFTHKFGADDLHLILTGIEKIMGAEKTEDDPDAIVGKDGYTGPRVDIHLTKKGKSFHNVPLGILKKSLPSYAKNYQGDKKPDMVGPLSEGKSLHHLHKEYRMYEGNNHIHALFEDGTRLVFEVHYHNTHGEDRDKWRRKAFSKWKSLASEIHNDVQLTEAGNPVQKSWKEAFQEALKHPELEGFIRKPHHQRVFDQN